MSCHVHCFKQLFLHRLIDKLSGKWLLIQWGDALSSSVVVPTWPSVMLTSQVRLTAQVKLSQVAVGAAVVVGQSDKQVTRDLSDTTTLSGSSSFCVTVSVFLCHCQWLSVSLSMSFCVTVSVRQQLTHAPILACFVTQKQSRQARK